MIVRYLLFAAVLILQFGCDSKKSDGPPPDTATTGTMEFIADIELQPAIDSLVAGFNADHPEAKVAVKYLAATEALDAMLQRKSRLVIMGRALTSKEQRFLDSQQVELVDFDIALNALAPFVKVTARIHELPLVEIMKNVTGTAPSYTQVLGSHLSSTESILDSIYLADTSFIKGRVLRFSTPDSVFNYVKSDPEAVGYLSSAWYKRIMSDSTVRILDLVHEGEYKMLMLHMAYVYQGKYPLVSRVMGYTLEPPNTLPRGFLAYAMSADGQRILLDNNLLPRTQIIKLVPPKE